MKIESIVELYVESFVWEHHKSIIPVTCIALPLAIEMGSFFKQLYSDPSVVKKNLSELKDSIQDAFKQRQDETNEVFRARLQRNIAISFIGLTTLGIAICSAFYLLPPSSAISVALVASNAIGELFAGIYRNPNPIEKVKNYLSDVFCQRSDESLVEFKERRWEGVKQLSVIALTFAAAIGAAFATPHLLRWISNSSSVWALAEPFFDQSEAMVMAEYFLVGGVHLGLSAYHEMNGDRSRSTFHLIAGLSGFLFPVIHSRGGETLRLHHSMIGLLMQLAPLQPVRTVGSCIALDSASYIFAEYRQFSYDYMNALFENFSLAVLGMVTTSLVEKGLNNLSKRKEA